MNYAALREKMVIEQLLPRGITNPAVLAAFRKVPREEFVPDYVRASAYVDAPLAIGHGQTISQPYTVALMTELLDPRDSDRVLEIGAGSGYQAAILAELVSEVFSVEFLPELAVAARTRLQVLGYENITVVAGDGRLGLPERSPFDKIIITAATAEVPSALTDQLAVGGCLVAPVGGSNLQEMTRLTKEVSGQMQWETFGFFRFVPLVKA